MSSSHLQELPKGTKVPDHIAIIPDGNRRWARSRGLPAYEGHKAGAKNLVQIMRAARKLGVHTTTFWGLSTENWRERDLKEVNLLMKTISYGIKKYLKEAKKEGVKVVHLGRKDRLPKWLVAQIARLEQETRSNTKYIFNIALDYGGQDEIVRAIQAIIKDGIKPEKVDTKLIDSYMDTRDQPYPYPDLIIRTSGEQRTSGLLLWQSHYAETYWESSHFPDFTPSKLREAILDYSRRRRRFGGNDEVSHFAFKPELVASLELSWWRLQKIPKGTRFRDAAVAHLREQFGLSRALAGQTAHHLANALLVREKGEWNRAKKSLGKFYKLIKDEVKLAFEPSLVASLEVDLWKGLKGKDNVSEVEAVEETARQLYAEVYRISLLQSAKLAHLRVMAFVERNLAEAGFGDQHWDRAEDYLQKFYRALKEQVA